jgi:hypothetical protein
MPRSTRRARCRSSKSARLESIRSETNLFRTESGQQLRRPSMSADRK